MGGQIVRWIIKSQMTITSSSREGKILRWNHHLKEKREMKMFSHDHKFNLCVPQPTTFDRAKPSFIEWSEEEIAFLAVTDPQDLIPLLSAAASLKDVVEKNVMFKGVLPDLMADIKKHDLVKKEADRSEIQAKISLKKFRMSPKKFRRL